MPPVATFKQAEEEYFRLKGQLATGRITREQFDAALKQLMIQDAQGRYWMLGPDSGKWYVHDGQNWVEAQPTSPPRPLSLRQAQGGLHEERELEERSAPPRGSSKMPCIVIGVVALLLGVIAVIIGFLALNPLAPKPLATPTFIILATIAPASPTAIVFPTIPPSTPVPTIAPTGSPSIPPPAATTAPTESPSTLPPTAIAPISPTVVPTTIAVASPVPPTATLALPPTAVPPSPTSITTPAPTSTPTQVPCPPITALLLSGGGAIGTITFAAGVTRDNLPVDPMSRFPEGVIEVFGVFSSSGMSDGTLVKEEWCFDGYLSYEDSYTWKGGGSGNAWTSLWREGGLYTGSYEFRWYIAGQLAQYGAFTVEQRQVGAPFFSSIRFAEGMQNNQPINLHTPDQPFKAGTKIVYGFYSGGNLTSGLMLKREVYYDGTLFSAPLTASWPGGAMDNLWTTIARRDDQPLDPGTYEIKLYINDQLAQLGTFVVEP